MSGQKQGLNKFFLFTNRITDFLAGITAVSIFIVVIWQIFGRLLSQPAPWTEELTRYLFIWMIYLGIGIGFRKAESARVTLFLNYSPKFVRNSSTWIYAISTIGFFLFMIVMGIELMSQQINTNEKSSVLLLPMWIIGLSVPFAGLTGIINVVQSLIYDKELLRG